MTNPKILLTGATGFIGTNFVLQLYKKYEIVALVRPSSNTSKINSYCKIFRYDENIESLFQLFKQEQFDGIVHLASMVSSTTNPINNIQQLINANITFGTMLTQAAIKHNISFFINASTTNNYCNSLFYYPSSLYAATKKAFEDIMLYYSLISQTIFTNLLVYNVYGPNDTKYLLSFLKKISQTDEELLMSDGSQIVDYSHVYDVVSGFDCLIELIQKNPEFCKNKIFSLKGKERQPLKEIVMLYEKILGKKLNIKWGARPQSNLTIMKPWEGGETLPNWEQKITLQEGFKMMIQDKENN